jgi:ceramide glucosyltransferase
MVAAIWPAIAFVCFAVAAHLVSVAITIWQFRKSTDPNALDVTAPVTILRPVCGIDNYAEATLASTFVLDWPCYEVIFCSASEADPVVPLIKRLMARHPDVAARLLTGDDRISINPKLNNLVKGWSAAKYEWIVMSDSNVLLPPDFLKRVMSQWTPATGLVCSPPVGGQPSGFAAELECAFLNTYEARWQIVADGIGLGFAQGKTMLWRREVLDGAGGVPALARETAEDAAATKVVRAAGLSVRLDPGPFIQPLGLRDLRSVWSRQVRWARLRRASFKLFFVLELLGGGVLPLSVAAILVAAGAIPFSVLLGLFVFWYGAEVALARLVGWHMSVRSVPALILRDLLIPLLWVLAWTGDSFNWRGNAMRVERQASGGRLAGFIDLAGGLVRNGPPLSTPELSGLVPAQIAIKIRGLKRYWTRRNTG